MIHSKEVEEAKALLKENGYYTDNLWHIDDVKANYECEDDSEAQEVLDSALTNEATMDQILSIADWLTSKNAQMSLLTPDT